MTFSGETYNPTLDKDRLEKQWKRVYNLMLDGAWRTLREISYFTNDPESSISARLRDLRNKYGFTVERRRKVGHEEQGVWEYRVVKFSKVMFDVKGQGNFL